MANIIAERIAQIPPLSIGTHRDIGDGACFLEAVSYIIGEQWSALPECVCPVIGKFFHYWNDGLSNDDRDPLLRPFMVRVVNTRSTNAIEKRRAIMAADWLIREHTPVWLRFGGLMTQADALASLPEITNFAQAPSLLKFLKEAQAEANLANAGAESWASTDGASWAVSGNAAGAATMVPLWDVAWAATLVPLWKSIWKAAMAAAGYPARAATGAALRDTTQKLQQSAARLVDRMIAAQEGG